MLLHEIEIIGCLNYLRVVEMLRNAKIETLG